jgi:hypothetical protein
VELFYEVGVMVKANMMHDEVCGRLIGYDGLEKSWMAGWHGIDIESLS